MWGVSRSFRRGKVYRDPIIGTMGDRGSDIPSGIGDGEENIPERLAGAP